MKNWITKIWLPFLLLALVVAIYFESSSVKTIDLDKRYSTPTVSALQQPGKSPKKRVVSRLAVGESYASLKELAADQKAAGFVLVGYFGKFWPAQVTEATSDDNGISFVRQNGTRHNYTKFGGYGMKMVRLSAGDQETIVVFRSRLKRH
jgi:hypothetical protein